VSTVKSRLIRLTTTLSAIAALAIAGGASVTGF
jgi:hypothetical protein